MPWLLLTRSSWTWAPPPQTHLPLGLRGDDGGGGGARGPGPPRHLEAPFSPGATEGSCWPHPHLIRAEKESLAEVISHKTGKIHIIEEIVKLWQLPLCTLMHSVCCWLVDSLHTHIYSMSVRPGGGIFPLLLFLFFLRGIFQGSNWANSFGIGGTGRQASPEVWGEWSPSKPEASLSPWAPRTPMGKAWSPEARSASGSSLTGKEMSLMGSSFILGGLESSRAFSGFTSRSYSSDRSLLTCKWESLFSPFHLSW